MTGFRRAGAKRNRFHRRPRGPYGLALSGVGLPRILTIAVLGLVAAGLSVALTASTLVRRVNPDVAVKLMPIDSLAVSYRAEQLLTSGQSTTQVAELARKALRLQAINPTAFQILGLVATAGGDARSGRTLIAQAQRQSRREAPTQFWLIEDAVQRGDVNGALVHYDIVLRTKQSTHETLFPILRDALKEPTIRAALARYYHTDVIWAPRFATYALTTTKDLESLAALTVDSGGLRDPKLAHDQSVGLIARLVLENRFAAARRVYLAMPGAVPGRLSDPGLDSTDITARYGAIGWQTRTQAEATSSLAEGEAGRPELVLAVNGLTTATLATKLLYLQAGRYRADVQLSQFEGGNGAAVGVQIRCPALTGDQPLWSERASTKAIRGEFVVPQGCDTQYLDIVGSGGASESGLSATVRSVAIRRQ